MTNIVVCCDGTWNTPTQEENGRPSPTNVVKLHSAVSELDGNDGKQKKYYRPGVGTDGNIFKRLRGGGLGAGLSDDIKSAYKWLCDNYSDEDDIFIFGFSRGAYAVRSLVGLISKCSLLDFGGPDELSDATKWDRIDKAYSYYRDKKSAGSWRSDFPQQKDVRIRFLGVWDTVGALGIPDELTINFIDRTKNLRFHDTKLSSIVQTARHAVAIDERRQTFSPTLWTGYTKDHDIEQKWFPGVHGDVGGSYTADGLGDIALSWMMTEAARCGLNLKKSAKKQVSADHMGVLHDSVKGLFARMRTRPRSVPKVEKGSKDVHVSAVSRQDDPPLIQPDYWRTVILNPTEMHTCQIYAREHWNATSIYLEKGKSYEFTASGEWLDASIPCDPSGSMPGFELGKLAFVAAKPFDWLQGRRRAKTKNSGAVMTGARREQDFPWFCLVGVISNGLGVDTKSQELNPHEVFKIGAGCSYVSMESGYLYCFANDVWSFYWNNKGSVRLNVTCK